MNNNPAAERAVLSGICRYGSDAYYDVCDLIRESSFTIESNKIIYKCLKHVLEADGQTKIDLSSIYSAANSLGLSFVFEKKHEVQHLQSIMAFPIEISNTRKFAAIIGKLEISRLLEDQLKQAGTELNEITGEESISHILGLAENAIFNFSSLMNDEQQETTLGSDIDEFIKNLEENPVDTIGIPTGYKLYDSAIGGGLRDGTVNVIGARIKQGKSMLTDNIGQYVSDTYPVLNVDTEMTKEDHQVRTLALLSQVPIDDIGTGKFSLDPIKKKLVHKAKEKIKKKKFFFRSIGGMPFEEQMAIMRRWLVKEVGLKPNGTANKCVIIYDYIKLMSDDSLKNMQEYQAIGFLMTGLHNFALRYKIPILAYVQLNRDGVTKETSDVAAQSDRVLWLCSNFTIWKSKSEEEIAQDGPDAGNKKMVPVVARHGKGITPGDYINFKFEGWCGRITEGCLHTQVVNNANRITDTEFKPKEGCTDEDFEVPFE